MDKQKSVLPVLKSRSVQAIRRELGQELKDLKARSKELYQLVVGERFIVNEILGESYATSFNPDVLDIRFGGSSQSHEGGFTSGLVLTVTPDNKGLPVKTLNFRGNSPVRSGDHILAQIPRYKKEEYKFNLFLEGDRDHVFYVDRAFNPEENAIELAILSPDGVMRYRAVNYGNFMNRQRQQAEPSSDDGD